MQNILLFSLAGGETHLQVDQAPLVGETVNFCLDWFERLLTEELWNGRIIVSTDGDVTVPGTVITVVVGPKTFTFSVTAYFPIFPCPDGRDGPRVVQATRLI